MARNRVVGHVLQAAGVALMAACGSQPNISERKVLPERSQQLPEVPRRHYAAPDTVFVQRRPQRIRAEPEAASLFRRMRHRRDEGR